MTNKRLEVIESSLQKTNLWLKDIEHELHQEHDPRSRVKAYAALRSVLHAIRDCLPVSEAVKFVAQMPLIVSGVYYDGWKPRVKPKRLSRAQFYEIIRESLRNQEDLDPALASQAVIRTLYRHLSRGEIQGVKAVLPKEVRLFWDEVESGLFEEEEVLLTEGPPRPPEEEPVHRRIPPGVIPSAPGSAAGPPSVAPDV